MTTLYKQILVPGDDERVAHIFIALDGTHHPITYAEFRASIITVAHNLIAVGIRPGDRVGIMLPHSPITVTCLIASMMIGAIPSIFRHIGKAEEDLARVKQLQADHAIDHFVTEFDPNLNQADTIHQVSPQQLQAPVEATSNSPTSHQTTAFIQYTSGTTSRSKGVIISHTALLNNIDMLAAALEVQTNDVMITWLPLYHDMGLVASILMPLIKRIPIVQIDPGYWVRAPWSLFRLISDYKASICWMPNFAFDHCTQYVSDTHLAGLDLSSMRYWSNAAEPIRHRTTEQFIRTFQPYGLRESAIATGYGMAENVVGVTCSQSGRRPRVDWINRQRYQAENLAIPDATGFPVVSVGRALQTAHIQIVGEKGEILSERHVGEITVTSSSLFDGYVSRREIGQAPLKGGYYFTGDYGYMSDGELYFAGRVDDMAIIGGKNIYPNELEGLIFEEFADSIRRSVAFGIDNPATNTQAMVVAIEPRRSRTGPTQSDIEERVRQLASHQLGIRLFDVCFVERGWVEHTTSGKVSRSANREKYLKRVSHNLPRADSVTTTTAQLPHDGTT